MSDPDGLLDAALDDIAELSSRVEDLEATMDDLAKLRERVQRLEDRTDMLRLIEDADQLEADQRRAALWQHAVREARQSRSGKVALDHDDVQSALHFPDVHRTTLYNDMSEVADAVTADGIAEYVPREDSHTGSAELRVDLAGIDESVDASTLYEGGD